MSEAQSPTNELILELKGILERKNKRSYTYDEVVRIGRGLVGIYRELADNPLGIGHKKRKEKRK